MSSKSFKFLKELVLFFIAFALVFFNSWSVNELVWSVLVSIHVVVLAGYVDVMMVYNIASYLYNSEEDSLEKIAINTTSYFLMGVLILGAVLDGDHRLLYNVRDRSTEFDESRFSYKWF